MQQRTCGQCGTPANEYQSVCLQCGAMLGTADPAAPPAQPAGGQFGGPPVPPPPGAAQPWAPQLPSQPEKSSSMWSFALIAILVVGAIAGGVWYMTSSKGIPLPESVSGAPRLHNSEADGFTSSLEKQLQDLGGKARIGVYGTSMPPSYMLAAYQEPGSLSFDEEWGQVTGGFAEAGGAGVGATSVMDATVSGKQLRCASSADDVVICVFGADNRYAVIALYEQSDVQTGMDLATQVLAPMDDTDLG